MNKIKEKAQIGLKTLKDAIFDFITLHKDGVSHSTIVKELGLESDFEGSQKNYLSWSVLGLLVNEGKVKYDKRGNRKIYFVA